MKKFLTYVLVLSLLLPMITGCGRPRIIPRDKMAKIYAEMFIADQWLHDHPAARRVADTTFFYEPIFNKYGYSFKDYAASVDKYINEPEKFAKVLKNTAEIIGKREKEVQNLKDIADRINAANAAIFGYETKDFTTDSARWQKSRVMWGPDTLAVEDSLHPGDSLAVRDSLARLDSLSLRDTLAVHDSIIKQTINNQPIEICNLQ